MALAFSNVTQAKLANKRVVFATVTFDNSYPTGGETVAPANVGLSKFDFVLIGNQDSGGGEQVVWDRANAKLMVFTGDGTEAGNASNQSGVIVDAMFVGR